MAKAKNPVTFSKCFSISPDDLDKLGVLDPTLAIDTKLFIDPLLLQHSSHNEIRSDATKEYRTHFENIIKLLSHTRATDDVAWRSAQSLFKFHEIKGTCLGYGAGSISGSGFGIILSNRLLLVAKEIVDLGVRDPDLFPLMALFEADFGPDRISDMVTNVIINALSKFNKKILDQLRIEGEEFKFIRSSCYFARNPIEKHRTPIILVPHDILRKLPVARDWDEISDVASKNQELRYKVNTHIAHIWAKKTKRDKAELKSQALSNFDSFKTLLDIIHSAPATPYNSIKDPDALISWARLPQMFTSINPLTITIERKDFDLNYVYEVVKIIIDQFRHLVENRGLNREFYKENKKPRHESSIQRIFFAVAYSYCEANNLDISPEIDTGTGKIDFKFSTGFKSRVLVEVKLSTNPRLVSGYLNQLEVYKTSEKTMKAFYLVIDVGGMGKKDSRLFDARNKASSQGHPLSDLEFVDASSRPTASKRHDV